MWFIYVIEHYSSIKKNEIMTFTGKWTERHKFTMRPRKTGSVFSLMWRCWTGTCGSAYLKLSAHRIQEASKWLCREGGWNAGYEGREGEQWDTKWGGEWEVRVEKRLWGEIANTNDL